MRISKWKIAAMMVAAAAMVSPGAAFAQQDDPGAGKIQDTLVGVYYAATQTTTIRVPPDRNAKAKVQIQSKDSFSLNGGIKGKVGGNLKLQCPDSATNDLSKGCGTNGAEPAGALWTFQVFGAINVNSAVAAEVVKGKFIFKQSGKNSFDASAQAGAAVLSGTSMKHTGYSLHDAGTDQSNPTTGCGADPLAADQSACVGAAFAVGGIVWGDSDVPCSSDGDCSTITLVCVAGECEIQTCSVPGDCNSGYCDSSTGNCCDPNTSESGTCASPSGAFVDGAFGF